MGRWSPMTKKKRGEWNRSQSQRVNPGYLPNSGDVDQQGGCFLEWGYQIRPVFNSESLWFWGSTVLGSPQFGPVKYCCMFTNDRPGPSRADGIDRSSSPSLCQLCSWPVLMQHCRPEQTQGDRRVFETRLWYGMISGESSRNWRKLA